MTSSRIIGQLAMSRGFNACIATMHGVHAQIVTAKILRQHFAELHIVIDQQDIFHGNGHNQRKPCAALRL